ncbi:MAG: hypothetical protein Q7S96_03785 [bacterium]|nr:hypothetical protein [bacterium]
MSKHEQPTLPQVQWLLERANAKEDPITREDVQRFGRHPHGPILPDTFVRGKRLPERYGTWHNGEQMSPQREPYAYDLAVAPSGELWVATVIEGDAVLVNHGAPHFEDVASTVWLGDAFDDETACYLAPRIVGFKPDGVPVSVIESVIPDTSHAYPSKTLLFVAEKRVLEGAFPKQRLKRVYLSPQGHIITMTEVGGAICVYRDGVECCRDTEDYSGAWVFDDNVLVITPFGEGSLFRMLFNERRYLIVASRIRYEPSRQIVNVRGKTDDFTCTIVTKQRGERCGVVTHERYTLGSHAPERISVRALGTAAYVGHETELPNGQWCYVGMTARDNLQCMVVEGFSGPGFDRVSNAFIDNGKPYYYGIIGRHLCLMEIPQPA